ncbi:MAG: murein biosynthesis integral membrane protein MurJ [Deltaproteobacteria bacterium]|nr:MAG: murein biosynthesis integral membrane protein MurJ [Deltaproteobacteria bacterium]
MQEKRRIAKATGIMALATGLSRIAGLVRDMVVAAVFGAGYAADAFFVAFTIPNLLRRFFAEGSLTAAFVPTFAEVHHRDGAEASREVLRICWTLLLLVLAGVTLAGIAASPWVVQLIGYGFGDVPGKLELTDLLNRIMFPYIFFVSLVALLAGALNVQGHFLSPSLSPVLLNLAMIASALLLAPLFATPIVALAVGVLIGGILQLVMQLPVLYRFGYDLRPDFRFRHPAVRRVARLMIPGIVGVAIYQINVVVTRLFASLLEEGSVSWLYYGQRLFEFPQGIFVVSLAQAVLPSMSRQLAAHDEQGFRESFRFGLALILLITVPAALGMVLCAEAVYSLFFLGGAFTAYDVSQSAAALAWYAPGLIFVGVSRVVAPTFYALQDTRTPVWISFWTLLVSVGCSLLLMEPMKHAGLALALTISSIFNALALIWLLDRRLGGIGLGALGQFCLRLLPGLAAMGLVVAMFLGGVDWQVKGSFVLRALLLGGVVTVGGLVYLAGCWFCRVGEVKQGWELLSARLLRRRRGGDDG